MVTYNRGYFESPEGAGHAYIKGAKDLSFLLQSLAPKPGEKILDVGCGLGRFAGVIAEHGSDVTGIDISEYAIEQAKERYKGKGRTQFICMNVLNMNFEDYFDKILCYHFIEHLTLPDTRILLKKIHSALKNEGTLVIGLPIDDVRFLRRIVHFMATRRRYSYTGHLVSFSVPGIKREVVSAGFSINDICLLSYFGLRVPRWFPQIPLTGLPIVCADIYATKQ